MHEQVARLYGTYNGSITPWPFEECNHYDFPHTGAQMKSGGRVALWQEPD